MTMKNVQPTPEWTKGMKALLRKIIKENNFVTWKTTYKHVFQIFEYETRKRNRRLTDIKTKVLGSCSATVGTRVTRYVEHDPYWPYPIENEEHSPIQCMGSVIAHYKIYSNGDVEAEARCGACGRLHDSKVTLGNTPTPWSHAMYSLRNDPYWKEYAQSYLEKNKQKKRELKLEKKRAEDEKLRKEEEARIKREEVNRKKKQTIERNQRIVAILRIPHPCPHCGSSKKYEKKDIIKGTEAIVICKKWRCKKEFIIQDIATLYHNAREQLT